MNRFIIADATKCIGCRTCEVACAVSHHENQDCAAVSPDEFISRICVIKDHCWITAVACHQFEDCLLYTLPSPRDVKESRLLSSARQK